MERIDVIVAVLRWKGEPLEIRFAFNDYMVWRRVGSCCINTLSVCSMLFYDRVGLRGWKGEPASMLIKDVPHPTMAGENMPVLRRLLNNKR